MRPPSPGTRFVLFFALLLLASCQEPPPVRIAIVAPLTRFSSEFGTEGRNGAILAIEEINAQGGIHGQSLEPVVRDVGGGPDSCKLILKHLLDSGVQFIIGPFTSNMAIATMDAMAGANALLITPTMSSALLESKDDAILRMQTTNLGQAGEIAKVMRQRKVKKIAAIYDISNREYTQTLVTGLQTSMAADKEVVILVDSIVPGIRNPEDVANQLAHGEYDAIYIASLAQRTATIAQILRRDGNQDPLYGCSWNMTAELLAQGGNTIEGMVFSGPTPPAGVNPKGKAFETRFFQRFGKTSSFAGAESYEAVHALAQGLRKAGSSDPKAVRDTLLQSATFSGVYDDFSWNATGDVNRPISVVEVKNGAFQLLVH